MPADAEKLEDAPKPAPEAPKRMVPVAQAAKEAGVPVRTARRWVAEAKVRSATQDGVAVVDPAALCLLRIGVRATAASGRGLGRGTVAEGPPPAPADPVDGNEAAAVLAAFEAGKSTTEAVIELRLSPDKVAALHGAWLAFKGATVPVDRAEALEQQIAQLEHRESERAQGDRERDQRDRERDQLLAILDRRLAAANAKTEQALSGVQAQVSELAQHVQRLPLPSAEQFVCGNCRVQGMVVTTVECSSCHHPQTWGFRPERR